MINRHHHHQQKINKKMNNNPMDNGTIDEDMEIIIEVDNLMMEMEIEIIIGEDQIIIINNKEEDHVGLSPCISQL